MMNKLKNYTKGLAIVAALYASAAGAADNGWMNIQPAYNANDNHVTVRIEGGADVSDKVSVYSFADIDASKQEPLDFENLYGEARFKFTVNDWLKVLAEHDFGTGFKDFTRLGVEITPSIDDNNFTAIRVFPYETDGDVGSQIDVYSAQQITDKLNASILAELKLGIDSLYAELELGYDLSDDVTLFGQLRHFGSLDQKIEPTPVVGAKYNF